MKGLIIGKFCPPHKGHDLLIKTALAETDSLTVLVCESQADPIPASLRLEWLRELYPEVTFHSLYPDRFDRNDERAWVAASLEALGSAPDTVFSSEAYGERYAELLGSSHRMVDRERSVIACSASAILANPQQNLHFLDGPVRRHFAA